MATEIYTITITNITMIWSSAKYKFLQLSSNKMMRQKTIETNKRTDRLIGNHMLVISSDDDFYHDGDGNDDGEVNDDDDVELHQLCSLGGFCDLVEPHPSF